MKMHPVHHAAVLATLVLSAIRLASSAVAAEPAAQTVPQDVQVIGPKLDEHTLHHAAMKFVESHAAVSPTIRQMGRWRDGLCPSVTGLAPRAAAFVTGQVEEVARSVGVRTNGTDKHCAVNVEIVFTSEPQRLLDHIAQNSPVLLGSSRSAGDTVFSRAIQSWYLTETRSTVGYQPPADPDDGNLYLALSDTPFKSSIAKVDPDYGAGSQPSGLTGSYFTKGLTDDLLHVLVIVDTRKVAARSLRAIADYISMIALTRMSSLDACSELPSIIDLLSSGCSQRGAPPSLTDADTAYLKALYSSDREANFNLEQADMRDRMVKTILRK